MADIKKNISFNLLEIKTDQFALFEENHIDNGKISLLANSTFSYNDNDCVFFVTLKFIFEIKKKPFITIQNTCVFSIETSSIKKLKVEGKLIFPKEFVAHLAMITVGTSRGILHMKTENTIFNQYILPTIDVTKMIPEDLIF